MSIKKQFLKKRPECKVTFKFPKKMAGGASTVQLVGDFNEWDRSVAPMDPLKNGDFKSTLYLEANREYQFRYLLDGERWENDPAADKYVASPYSDAENSVVIT